MSMSIRLEEVSFMNKGKWLRFVIAGGLLALVIPTSAMAYPTVDDGFAEVKERAPASSACSDNPRLWKLDPTICSDSQPVAGSGLNQPAPNMVPATSSGGIETELLLGMLAILLAGAAGTIVVVKRRPHTV
jgi:hypothetical protein